MLTNGKPFCFRATTMRDAILAFSEAIQMAADAVTTESDLEPLNGSEILNEWLKACVAHVILDDCKVSQNEAELYNCLFNTQHSAKSLVAFFDKELKREIRMTRFSHNGRAPLWFSLLVSGACRSSTEPSTLLPLLEYIENFCDLIGRVNTEENLLSQYTKRDILRPLRQEILDDEEEEDESEYLDSLLKSFNLATLEPASNESMDSLYADSKPTIDRKLKGASKSIDEVLWNFGDLDQCCREYHKPESFESCTTKTAPGSIRKGKETSKPIDELLSDVEKMVGMENIKREVKGLCNLVKIRQLRQESGLPSPDISLHLVFTGNPGTGKTMVARALSKIYRELHVLSKGHLVEVDRSGLIAGYLGQTSQKMMEVLKSSLGGVLFIDEAYSLTCDPSDSYGKEAVDVLLKFMEDHRDDLIVIVAGYPQKMREFIDSNPGLRSRFNKFLDFPDYSWEELLRISILMFEQSGYKPSEDALFALGRQLIAVCKEGDHYFANARTARNLVERAIQSHADRIACCEPNPSKTQLERIEECDIPNSAS